MRHVRFHLGTLVILVLVLGIGFAALRESNETWDNITFSITLGVLLTSILLAIHRTEKRWAFWLGFALFGWAYLGLSLVPSIESRLITTKALAFIDSKVPRSIPAGFAYADFDNDGKMDLYVVNNSQPNVLYPNKGSVVFEDVTASSGLNLSGNQVTGSGNLYLNNSAGLWLRGSVGTTEYFMRIGHSLLALIAAFLGGQLSRHFFAKNREPLSRSVDPQP
jgi:filamentous hemagglutinin family protein